MLRTQRYPPYHLIGPQLLHCFVDFPQVNWRRERAGPRQSPWEEGVASGPFPWTCQVGTEPAHAQTGSMQWMAGPGPECWGPGVR